MIACFALISLMVTCIFVLKSRRFFTQIFFPNSFSDSNNNKIWPNEWKIRDEGVQTNIDSSNETTTATHIQTKKKSSKPGTKTIFDIKFVNTISFQSCINIYTHVWKMQHTKSERERGKWRREASQQSRAHHIWIADGPVVLSICLYLYVCVCALHETICICSNTWNASPFFLPFHRANDANRDQREKKICSSNFIVVCCCCRCFHLSLFNSLVFVGGAAVAVAVVRTLVCVR